MHAEATLDLHQIIPVEMYSASLITKWAATPIKQILLWFTESLKPESNTCHSSDFLFIHFHAVMSDTELKPLISATCYNFSTLWGHSRGMGFFLTLNNIVLGAIHVFLSLVYYFLCSLLLSSVMPLVLCSL